MVKANQQHNAQRKKRAGRFDKIAGAHIRKHRQAAGLSQEGLAQTIGLTFQQVQKYENGSNRIALPVFARIAKTFSHAGVCSGSELFADIMREAGLG